MFSINIVAFIAIIFCASAWVSSSTEVITKLGKIEGLRRQVLEKSVEEYLGIPYAEQPTGENRFRRPIPVKPWSPMTKKATAKPNSCPQILDVTFPKNKGATMWNANTPRSEDCLYLNVWVPFPRKPKQAVMVWIYGGGYFSGSSTLDVYDGKILSSQNDIILVSMQYRLSGLGFATLNNEDMPGNIGLFDQLEALKWVNQHIESFGGDPTNVTIFGESAGAASVNIHLLSDLSDGLFQRAIMQSAAATAPWAVVSAEEGVRRTLYFAHHMKCNKTTSDGKLDKPAVAACLRKVKVKMFNRGEDWLTEGHAQFPFVPIIDRKMIAKKPEKLLENSKKKTPILLGFNRDEGTFFLLYEMLRFYNKTELMKNDFGINQSMFDALLKHTVKFYPAYPSRMSNIGLDATRFEYNNWKDNTKFQQNLKQLHRAAGDLNFVCDVVNLANAYSQAKQKVFLYYFTHRTETHNWPEWMGVIHGDEISYVFGEPLNTAFKYTEAEKVLSRRMMNYWVTFAKTGDPNNIPASSSSSSSTSSSARSAAVSWPQHTATGKENIVLNTATGGTSLSEKIGRAERAKACGFWKSYLPQLLHITGGMTKLIEKMNRTLGTAEMKYTLAGGSNSAPLRLSSVVTTNHYFTALLFQLLPTILILTQMR